MCKRCPLPGWLVFVQLSRPCRDATHSGIAGPSLITVKYSYYVLASAMLFICDNNESPRTGLLSGSCSYSGTLTRGEPCGQWTEPPALLISPGVTLRSWVPHQAILDWATAWEGFAKIWFPFSIHYCFVKSSEMAFTKLETILIYKVDGISFLRACLLIDESNLKTSLLVSSMIAWEITHDERLWH